jgi:hypothetical protein
MAFGRVLGSGGEQVHVEAIHLTEVERLEAIEQQNDPVVRTYDPDRWDAASEDPQSES